MAENWFWFIMLVAVTLPLWEAVGVLEVGVVLADILLAIFYGAVPVVVYPILFLLNIIVFAKLLFFKPIAPAV
jgi:hypothetical protein